jgi:peptide/nickel transport system substrate-binding protein
MFSNKKWMILIALVAIATMILPACAPAATPEVVVKEVPVEKKVVETVVVEKEVPVEKEVVKEVEKEVVKTVVVEKEVEVEVVVTATPEPITVSKGGTVIESTFADAEILNPILSVDTSSSAVNQYLYNALVRTDPDTLLTVPELAERWEVAEDEKTWTYYLHKDVKWHDGEPFTAYDVEFTYEMMLNEDVNSPRRSEFADLLSPEQIVVLDDYTIQFQLNNVDATWLCCKDIYGIIPKHILGDLTAEEFNAAEFNTLAPIGTGPFKFREWVKDDHVALVANPDYFQGAPNLDFIYYKIVENQTVLFAQLQTGEVDFGGVTAALWEEANKQENLQCKAYPVFGFNFYTYQMDPEKSSLFLDVRTRRALLYALDRQAFVDSIAMGLGDVANTCVPPISWAYNPDNEPTYPYDPEKAKELLEEAGWKDENGDGIREAHGVQGVEDGTPFSFELETNAGNVEREQLIQSMQQYWADVGVDAKPVPIEWNALLAKLTESYDYEVIMVGFSWDIDPDQKTMWHTESYGGGFNMNKYSNPTLDKILEDALLTTDQEKRKEYYFEMQRIVAEDVPAPILYFRNGTGCWNKRLHEFEYNAVDIRWNSHQWWVEK